MKKPGLKKKRQDLYFLPSLLSIISVFFGFMSIVSSLHAHYSWAAFWIILAAMMDGLDGIIARATHSASEFGTQIDSLADTFSFGAAPSILLYLWGMQSAGPSVPHGRNPAARPLQRYVQNAFGSAQLHGTDHTLGRHVHVLAGHLPSQGAGVEAGDLRPYHYRPGHRLMHDQPD
jgi:hypothetical protein